MTTRLKVRYYGDPVLRRMAQPVRSVGPVERLFIKELISAMYAYDGTGLAAIQVGLEEQIFVADFGEGPFAVINPMILEASSHETFMEEGCLSFPEIRFKVKRPESIRVRYVTESNMTVERELSGLPAKIFQHETDHLNAKMIIDHASPEEREKFKPQLTRLETLAQKKKQDLRRA
ncbi:MAG: peptide deformylase [Candidatus Omnitrophica bacterium]|nr:peptide deformylase [Candidatus Omnitrophota bacterium]